MAEPAWLTLARAQIGVREIVGTKHSPTIMRWIQELGAKALGMKINDDETPWCGTFMAWLMKQLGLTMPLIPVRAASWGRAGKYGRELLGPRLGCIMVFTRHGGGHVGLYIGEDEGDPRGRTAAARAPSFHILGGNQSNSVSIMRIAKERLAPGGMRWPQGPALPPAQIVRLKPSGAPASTNEA